MVAGIADYFAGSNGLDLDAFLEPNGALSAPGLFGAMGSYQHYLWNDLVSVTAIYSLLHLFDLGAGTNATLEQLQYVGGVLQVFPNKRFMTGFEYMFGERENRDGQIGPTTTGCRFPRRSRSSSELISPSAHRISCERCPAAVARLLAPTIAADSAASANAIAAAPPNSERKPRPA